MLKLWNKLNGWKTYITAGAAILTAISAYMNHTISLEIMLGAIFGAIQTANIRHAITTTATTTTGVKS